MWTLERLYPPASTNAIPAATSTAYACTRRGLVCQDLNISPGIRRRKPTSINHEALDVLLDGEDGLALDERNPGNVLDSSLFSLVIVLVAGGRIQGRVGLSGQT